jgi:serine/threonine-protein kinase/endoribonuclease IRE1
LCPASLADIIENLQGHGEEGDRKREERKDIARDFDAKKAMKQIASGLRHLHGLGLVHRDIKPRNVLISESSSSSSRGRYRMLLSDFCLCKKLDEDQSSFLPTTYEAIAAPTAGWRAPEMLCGDDKLDIATNNSSSGASTICLTKSVDIFALGCLFFYILTEGKHPYGNRFDRKANIIKEKKDLSLLSSNEEAHDLITHMLRRQPSQRPDIEKCLLHPFFWDSAKRLAFLRDASDRFEVLCKYSMDKVLIRLERDAKSIVKTDWLQSLDQSSNQIFIKDLRKSRTYDGSSVRDLLRALRNKVSLSFKYLSLFLISTEHPLPRPSR